MTFEFGPFRLDEPARALRLEQRELTLQPRVFDLLTYLVRNRARVVSKDELLDALWPGLTVTDNSLQRAVSTLRGVLREGGMENAIRNFPRAGYRFCVDHEVAENKGGARNSAGNDGDAAHELPIARQAVAECRWNDASSLFARADMGQLAAEDLDNWAVALQCLGKPSDAIHVLVRSVAAHSQAGNDGRAAASAVALATIHLERGDLAVAKGWLARARDLVSATPDALAEGYLLWAQSRVAAAEGDPQRAFDLADAAYNFGLRRSDFRIEALGLMYRGFFRLSLGDTHGGLADQDHAAALALSNNTDPITGGVLYCNILWACRTFGDWSRANQWTLGYQQFCTSSRMEFSGSCQLHRAEVLGIRGSLRDALAHINDALDRLYDDAPWAVGDAHRVLGDIQAAIGNTDAALAAYEQSYALGWNPEPGYAMLLLSCGEPEAAYESLERSLIGQSWWTLQRRGMLLAHLALVAAHAGRHDRAHSIIDNLEHQDQRWPMPSIRALTNEASALLARERGEPNEALRRLHLARQLWTSVDSRLNAARVRLQIAALQLDMGDSSGALSEIRAASSTAEGLESDRLRQQCQTLRLRCE